MSLILVYLEVPDLPRGLRAEGLAVFPVTAKIARQPSDLPAIALTDGVASDRFVTFGDHVRGREGAKLRKTLIDFLALRLHDERKIYLKMLFPKGQLDTVVFDVKAAKKIPLHHLRDALKTLKPGDVLQVVNGHREQT